MLVSTCPGALWTLTCYSKPPHTIPVFIFILCFFLNVQRHNAALTLSLVIHQLHQSKYSICSPLAWYRTIMVYMFTSAHSLAFTTLCYDFTVWLIFIPLKLLHLFSSLQCVILNCLHLSFTCTYPVIWKVPLPPKACSYSFQKSLLTLTALSSALSLTSSSSSPPKSSYTPKISAVWLHSHLSLLHY